jgi:CubicO group peptidase (beta-lactamase class C family)
VFEPLGMTDTAFATSHVDRLGSCFFAKSGDDRPGVFDPPEGQWATPPAFPSGGGGLVSTLDDFHRFARMLLAKGRLPDGGRLLSRAAVEAMTTDQFGPAGGVSPDGAQGWGLGVGVQTRRVGLAPSPGSYGWTGGLGSAWTNDPVEDTIGVVLTTDMFATAYPLPAVIQDFWTCAYAAFDD